MLLVPDDVRSDGQLSLPLKTTMLNNFIKQLAITLFATVYLQAEISVAGQVKKPTSIKLAKNEKITLRQALEKAGGETAYSGYIYIVRETVSNFEIHSFRTKLVKAGKHKDFALNHGDYFWSRARDSALGNGGKGPVDYLPASKQEVIQKSKKPVKFFAYPKRLYKYQPKK